MDAKSYTHHITGIISNGMVTMAMGLGQDLGLFDVLLAADKPISAEAVAESLNLKLRYTKEWLSAMVAASVVQQDPDTGMYLVPDDHRDTLRGTAGFSPGLFTFCRRGDLVKNCFRKDGPYGFSYQESPEWFHWFQNYRATMSEATIMKEILPRLEQQGIVEKLKSGIRVLDLGCASGTFTLGLARRFPNSTFVGVDYSDKAIQMGRERCGKEPMPNLTFEVGNALDLPEKWTSYFDFVFVYDVLHDLPDPFKALEQIYKVMKEDGVFSLVEIGFHSNPKDNAGNGLAAMYYSCSMFICLPSSMSEEPHVGYGACWGREAIEKALEDKKFKILEKESLTVMGTKAFFFCTK